MSEWRCGPKCPGYHTVCSLFQQSGEPCERDPHRQLMRALVRVKAWQEDANTWRAIIAARKAQEQPE